MRPLANQIPMLFLINPIDTTKHDLTVRKSSNFTFMKHRVPKDWRIYLSLWTGELRSGSVVNAVVIV